MLCLKPEALDEEDHHPQSPNNNNSSINGNGNCNGGNNGGFILPINWGSSINRYLQWKNGKVWSKSFSAGDDSCNSCNSCSELEDAKPHERSGQETSQQMCDYKCQLEQEVKKLQQQLQEETDLNLALASALEHCGSPSSTSPGKLPDKAQELLDSIAVLAINVSKLEQEFVSLQFQLSQERNERRLAEYHLKHLPCHATSLFDSSLGHLTEPIARLCNVEEAEENMDDMPLPEAFIDNNYIVENLWHHPSQLSEEMVLRMRDIFIFLADSSKLSSSSSASPVSPHCPLANFLTSSTDSLSVTSLVSSPLGGGACDPYGVPDKVDWTCRIGTYSQAIEVSWLSVGNKELEYAAMALKRFRLLVEQLSRVDPSQMSYNEKLAFWINLYNALIMHAYLAYGVPRNEIKLFSLMQKAAYTVGGLSVSAADIECTVLKMNPATYRPQIAAVFALQKFKASVELQKYMIDHPEPLLHFVLSCGLHSSPAVRIFRPDNMDELLKRSMTDYIQASVGVSNKGKLLVPKLLHCFAKGVVEDSVLPDWICQFLSQQQASMVRKCLSRNKWRLLGARVFSVLPFDSRFRFLFLLDDKTSQPSKSEVLENSML